MPGLRLPRETVAAAAGLASAILLWRLTPDAFGEPRFWGEDGAIFFEQWRSLGWTSFFKEYAGYLHFAPRLIAAFAGHLPLEWTALVFLIGAAIGTGWVSFTIARALPGPIGFLAGLAPLVAFGHQEVLSTPTNLQWLMAVGLAALAGAPFSPGWRNRLAFVVIGGLSGPFSVFAAPAFLVRLVVAARAGRTNEVIISGAAIATASVQCLVILTSPRGKTSIDVDSLGHLFARLVELAVGDPGPVIWLVVIALVAGLLFGNSRPARWAMASVATALIVFTSVLYSSDPAMFDVGDAHFRYWYVPSAIMIIALLTMVVEERRWLALLGTAGLAIMAANVDWAALVRTNYGAAESWVEAVRSAPTEYVYPPGWRLTLP